MKISKDDLRWAASEGLLQSDQVEGLWAGLETRGAGGPRLDLGHVALYFGALVVMGAMGWFVTAAWDELGGSGLLLVSASYAAVFFLVGRNLWKTPRLRVAAGLLLTVAVGLTPLVVYALQRTAGLWPQLNPGTYSGFHVWVHSRWIAMELATMAAGLAMARRFPFPFLMAPVSVALWYLSMDLTPLIAGDPRFTGDERASVSVAVGLAILLAAYLVDRRTRGDFAFWLYLCGLLAFWGGLTFHYVGSEATRLVYFAVNLLLILVAIALERPVFIVFGALGAFGYLGHLAYEVFAGSVAFPFALASSGVLVIFLAIKYQQHKTRIEGLLLSAVPPALRRLLPGARAGLAARE